MRISYFFSITTRCFFILIKAWVVENLVVNCRFTELGSNDSRSSDVPYTSGNCVCTHNPSGCQSLHVQLPAYTHSLVIAPVRERSADHHHPHPCQSSCCRKLTGKHGKKTLYLKKKLILLPNRQRAWGPNKWKEIGGNFTTILMIILVDT